MKKTLKQLLSVTLSLVMIFTMATFSGAALNSKETSNNLETATKESTTMFINGNGDVNADGFIDAADAIMIKRYDAGLINLTNEELKTADITGDGFVDAADAVKILRIDAGIENGTENAPEDIYEYTVENNEVIITGLKDNFHFQSVTIPSQINGKPVTTIGFFAFGACEELISVVIPDSVTTLGDSAFYGCTNLTDVKLSRKLTYLGENSFFGTAITEIEIPKSLSKVGYYYIDFEKRSPFSGALNLKKITFEEGITKIPDYMFLGCKSIENIIIPDSITTIGKYAFADCTKLANVKLGSHLTKMDYGSFSRTAITEIIIPKSLVTVGYYYNNLERSSPFYEASNLKKVIFENGTSKIPDCMLLHCESVEEIVIPNSVTTIGRSAFEECNNITNIIIPDSVTSIEDEAFIRCTNLRNIKLSQNLRHLGYAVIGETAITEITIPKTLTNVHFWSNGSAFTYANNLKKVIFEAGTTEIPDYMLYKCESVEKIVLPDSVATIGISAFEECTNLIEAILPNTLTTIGDCAFTDCRQLTNIEIPNSVTNIGKFAFLRINQGEITIPNSVTSIGSSAFDTNATLLVHSGSYAETYAKNNGYKFIILEEAITPKNLLSTHCYGTFSPASFNLNSKNICLNMA